MTTRHHRPNLTRWPAHKLAAQHVRMMMPPDGWIGLASYSQFAGITVQAASKRARNGQLGDAALRINGRWWVDPFKAERNFAVRAKPCNSRAARIEAALMAEAEHLAQELAGQSIEYCRAAIRRLIDQIAT